MMNDRASWIPLRRSRPPSQTLKRLLGTWKRLSGYWRINSVERSPCGRGEVRSRVLALCFLPWSAVTPPKFSKRLTVVPGLQLGCLLGASLCLAVSVVVAVVGVIKPQPFASISADEITNYLSDRFLSEPDLWRVHVRSLRALETATRNAQDGGNAAAQAINVSLFAFLAGLAFSVVSIGILIVELI